MRKLQRPVAQPCLAGTYVNWQDDAFRAGCYPLVRGDLEHMQHGMCAYCEGPAGFDAHVEHFVQRSVQPQDTFAWSNLFLSCTAGDRCGKYKDGPAGAYQRHLLIKPDVDDPDDYLRFGDKGDVQPRGSASQAAQARAAETIRVFHLDCDALTWARYAAVAGYVAIRDELLQQDPETLPEWVAEETANTAHQPFSSAIRHVLEIGL